MPGRLAARQAGQPEPAPLPVALHGSPSDKGKGKGSLISIWFHTCHIKEMMQPVLFTCISSLWFRAGLPSGKGKVGKGSAVAGRGKKGGSPEACFERCARRPGHARGHSHQGLFCISFGMISFCMM